MTFELINHKSRGKLVHYHCTSCVAESKDHLDVDLITQGKKIKLCLNKANMTFKFKKGDD